jgi:hypothetical protein
VVLGLGLVRVCPEVELVGGVRVVAGDGVGVRVVLGDDLFPGPARRKSLCVGPASVAEAVRKVLMEWGVRTRWLDSRLACDGPQRRRVRVGGRSKLEVGVLVVERNFAEFSGEIARDNFGKRREPSLLVGLLTINSCTKVRLDLQADKSPVVVKGPFFP